MEGFQQPANFTDSLGRIGLQKLKVHVLLAFDGVNSNQNVALGDITVVYTLRKRITSFVSSAAE